MKKILLTAGLLISAWTVNAQNPSAFWVENFENPCLSNCVAESYTSGNGAWQVEPLSGNTGDVPNAWYVSCTESGYSPGGCGSPCPGSSSGGGTIFPTGGSLHIGSNAGILGDIGAVFYNGSGITGLLDASTHVRVQSPNINLSGRSNVNVAFTFIEGGDGTNDNATVWYFDGATWTEINDLTKTFCCGGTCDGTNPGQWSAFNIQLPASANNNPNVKIGFVWINNNDAVGTDPSIAIDNLNLYENTVPPTNTITLDPISAPKYCQNAEFQISYTATGTFSGGNQFIAVLSDSLGNFLVNAIPVGSVASTTSGSITVTIPSSIIPASGYKLKVVSTIPAQDSQESNEFEVQNNPIATTSPDGVAQICVGASVDLVASSGASYQWSNSQTTQTITVSTPGTYSVRVTQSNLCFTISEDVIVVQLNTPAIPVITPDGPTTFCEGGNVKLESSFADDNLWSNGEVDPIILVEQSGVFTVTAINSNGCSATSLPTTVVVNPNPTQPVISPSGTINVCAPNVALLTSSYSTGNTWNTAETSESISAANTGSYDVTHTDANGCSSTSNSVQVNVNASPTAEITTSTGDVILCTGSAITLTSSSTNGNQWSTGATTNTIQVTSGGNYSLTVTNANNCSATTSVTIVENICVPFTQLRVSDCGNLNFNLQSSIVADQVVGATSYEFEIKDAADVNIIATILQPSRTLVIANVSPALNWNTQYIVRVRALVGTTTGGFGSPCTIGFIEDPNITAPPTTQLSPAFCNASNLTLTGTLSASPVVGATQYQFEFSQNSIVLATITQVSNTMNLASISSIINWGNTYQVRVRVYFGASVGAFGNVCNITFIQDPATAGIPLTQLVNANCGRLNFPVNGIIGANLIANATQYEFEFTQGGLPYATRISTNRFCGFNVISPALQAGQQYQVRVRAIISGVTGTFGNTCTIGLVSGSRFDLGLNSTAEDLELQEGEVLPEDLIVVNSNAIKVQMMPNPFSENFVLSLNNEISGVFSLSVFNIEGKLVEYHNNLNQNQLNVGNNLEKGLYLIELRGQNGWVVRERMVKTN